MKTDLQELIAGYLDGSNTPEETAALDERLRCDSAARRELLADAAMEVQLRVALGVENTAAGAGPDVTPAPEAAVRPPARRRVRLPPAVLAPLSIAAGIALVFAATHWLSLRNQREGEIVDVRGQAVLTADGGAQVRPVGVGGVVRCGDRLKVEASSRVTVKCRDGSVLRFYKNSEAIFVGGTPLKELRMAQGAFDAEIQPQLPGHMLVVTTPHAIARVIGTKFKLLTDAQSSWLGVDEGKVEMVRKADQRVVVVSVGYYAAVRKGLPFARLSNQCPYWRGQCAMMRNQD
jgi:hypothetical protein